MPIPNVSTTVHSSAIEKYESHRYPDGIHTRAQVQGGMGYISPGDTFRTLDSQVLHQRLVQARREPHREYAQAAEVVSHPPTADWAAGIRDAERGYLNTLDKARNGDGAALEHLLKFRNALDQTKSNDSRSLQLYTQVDNDLKKYFKR